MRKTICSKCGKFKQEGKPCTCKPNRINRVKKKSSDTKDIINTRAWKDKKRPQIIKRDGGLCQRCLIKYGIINNERIEVHHIKSRKDYPELAFDDNNLICVCKECNLALGTSNKLDFEVNWEYKETKLSL